MALIEVHLPDELVDALRSSSLDLSALAQRAVRTALLAPPAVSVDGWLETLDRLEPVDVPSCVAHRALDESRDQWGDG